MDKSELAARGELTCETCRSRPAQPALCVIGDQSGFWCQECARTRPWSEEMRRALAEEAAAVGLDEEAAAVGLDEEQIRIGLEALGWRLQSRELPDPPTPQP